jgi:hypothetical protein
MGDPRTPFDVQKCHSSGVQTKNRQDAASLLSFLRERIKVAKSTLPTQTAAPPAGAHRISRLSRAREPYQWEDVSYCGRFYPPRKDEASYLYNDSAADALALSSGLGTRAPASGRSVELAMTARA